MHGGVDQRLHQQEHVGRPGAADGGRHVEEALGLDVELAPERADDGPRLLALRRRHLRRGRPHRHALADLGRRIGHGPHDGPVPRPGRERFDGGAGHDRQQQRLRPERPADVGEHGRQHLRLDGQHDHVADGRGGPVVGGGADAEPAVQLLQPLAVPVAGRDAVGAELLARQQTADHRLGHRPGADERDPDVLEYVRVVHGFLSRRPQRRPTVGILLRWTRSPIPS